MNYQIFIPLLVSFLLLQAEFISYLEKTEKMESLEKNEEILEVNLELPEDLEINKMKLKKPNEVYIEMYKAAKNKAKLAKKLAIQAYLESKEIKKTYMLDLEESSEDEDLEKMIINDEESENKKILN